MSVCLFVYDYSRVGKEAGHPTVRHGRGNLQDFMERGVSEQAEGENVRRACAEHFKPKPSEIVERFKFNNRIRKPGESVASCVAELRSLSEFCNFGGTLEVMNRDRLVCGINDGAIQKRLLAEPKLTYAKAVEIAQSIRELRVKHRPAVDLPVTVAARRDTLSRSAE